MTGQAPIPNLLPVQTKVFQSSHIHSATYDPNTQSLQIRFATGRIYVSPTENEDFPVPVPANVWAAFIISGSPGRFFDREIKPFWEGVELKPVGEGGK